ncbi:MAG TPA: exonuclease domain-containing protein [Spirochaetota bacterium]|nr:exonuclease domain-containing protein [Spirochaetota bacterium]
MNSSLYDKTFCALDIETTGVNPFKDKIIEIGIVRFRIGQEQNNTYQSLIDPLIPVSEQSRLIHNISQEELEGKPLYSDIYCSIKEFIEDSILVIQNPQFDLSFIQSENRAAGLPFFSNRSFDTVSLAKKVFKGLKNHKLETVSRHLNCIRNFHRALDDAFCCMDIFLEGVKRTDPGRIFTISDLHNICGFDIQERVYKDVGSRKIRGVNISPDKEYEIIYCDRAGQTTERKILCKKIIKNGSTYFVHAFCYLREQDRFFKFSRIKNATLC